jgi:CMP-N,N'-diacetyllegionaminic acid synthase
MNIIAIIPARGGSKGIPKKNIKLLNGKPLIAYTIEEALKSMLVEVVVSTDCQEIAKISREYGARVVIRSNDLSKDATPTLPVLQDAILGLDGKYDAVMTLQATSPMRTAKHINEAIELFSKNKEADSLVSVVQVPHNFSPEKVMSVSGKYLSGNNKIKQRQEVEVMYARNGAAIYITKVEKLNKYIFGGKVLPYLMSKISSFDIDDMEDWEIIKILIKYREKK